jgi:hypothetical protein
VTLLPCPFCGSGDMFVDGANNRWVTCVQCYSSGPSFDGMGKIEKACAAWNKRTPLPEDSGSAK